MPEADPDLVKKILTGVGDFLHNLAEAFHHAAGQVASPSSASGSLPAVSPGTEGDQGGEEPVQPTGGAEESASLPAVDAPLPPPTPPAV